METDKNLSTSRGDLATEINDRLRRRYLDRLALRVKKLRKLLVERSWESLRTECGQLAASGNSFGFGNLTQLAIAVQDAIPYGKLSRAFTPDQAKQNAEALIAAVDSVLMDNAVSRA